MFKKLFLVTAFLSVTAINATMTIKNNQLPSEKKESVLFENRMSLHDIELYYGTCCVSNPETIIPVFSLGRIAMLLNSAKTIKNTSTKEEKVEFAKFWSEIFALDEDE